jgi:hypothetical protein
VKRYSWQKENQQPKLHTNTSEQQLGLIHFTDRSPRYLNAIYLPIAVEEAALSPMMQTSNIWHPHKIITVGLT